MEQLTYPNPEYPPTRLGRLGLANIKRRRAWIIAIWTLVSLIAGVVSYFSSERKSAQSTEEVVNKTLSNLVLQNYPAVENAVWLGDVQEFDVPWKDVGSSMFWLKDLEFAKTSNL